MTSTIDLTRSLGYVHGDHIFLQQLMEVFEATLAQLRSLLAAAQKSSPLAINHPHWADFYRALHGARPMLIIISVAQLREMTEQLCNSLETKNQSECLILARSFAVQLEVMTSDVTAVKKILSSAKTPN